jgi:dTDP-4-dehydrorhamnose reductase
MLAQKVIAAADCADRLILLDLPEFDITDRSLVLSRIGQIDPDIIINCAAYTQVDKCETEEPLALKVNADGAGFLAEAAAVTDAVLIHISTDYVFSGESAQPYAEEDTTGPLSAYGRTKLKGEQAILNSGLKRFFILRTSWLYGPGGPNFVETILRLAKEREELKIVVDQIGSPTYTGDLAKAIFTLLERVTDGQEMLYGIYHFSNSGDCSWYDFATEIVARAKDLGLEVKLQTIKPITTEEYPLPAVRPAHSVFNKSKYEAVAKESIPQWQISLKVYLAERQVSC